MLKIFFRRIIIIWILYFSCFFVIIVMCILIFTSGIITQKEDSLDILKCKYKVTNVSSRGLIYMCDSLLRSDYWFTHKINQNGDTIENGLFDTDLRSFFIPAKRCYPIESRIDDEYAFRFNNEYLDFGYFYDNPYSELNLKEQIILNKIYDYDRLFLRNSVSRAIYLFTFGLPQSFKITVGLCIYMIIFTLAEEGINRYIRRRRERTNSPEQDDELI